MVKAKVLVKSPLKKSNLSRKGNKVTKLKAVKVKSDGPKQRSKKFSKKVLKEDRGVVLLSHIPYGFFEEQIEKYFSQFGHVTRVKLPRSKNGKSKGYAFIEFRHPEVAEIAAETMNNYLMMNRLLKAKYIPPDEQKPWIFELASEDKLNRTTRKDKLQLNINRNRTLKNRKLSVASEAKVAARLLKRAKAMHEELIKLGADFEFEVKKESIESVFEKRKELKIKKKNILMKLSLNQDVNVVKKRELGEDDETPERIDENLNLAKKREIGEGDCTPELLHSNKKMKLAAKQKLEEKEELVTTDQSGIAKHTKKLKKKGIFEHSPAKSTKHAAGNGKPFEQTSIKRKSLHENSLQHKAAKNMDTISTQNSFGKKLLKNKKDLNKLSTSLPIKSTRQKGNSKNKNQTLDVTKDEFAVNLSTTYPAINFNEKKSLKTKKGLKNLLASSPIQEKHQKNKTEHLNQTLEVEKNDSLVNSSTFLLKNLTDKKSLKNKKGLKNLLASSPIQKKQQKNKSEHLNQTLEVGKNDSSANSSTFSLKNLTVKKSLKNKKGLKDLSTSLPIKSNDKSKNVISAGKKKRASIGILPQNGRPEKSKNNKQRSLEGNLNTPANMNATSAGTSTPLKQQSPKKKKKSLSLNETKVQGVSPKSPQKLKHILGPKVINKKSKTPQK